MLDDMRPHRLRAAMRQEQSWQQRKKRTKSEPSFTALPDPADVAMLCHLMAPEFGWKSPGCRYASFFAGSRGSWLSGWMDGAAVAKERQR